MFFPIIAITKRNEAGKRSIKCVCPAGLRLHQGALAIIVYLCRPVNKEYMKRACKNYLCQRR
jgi:hypothetical protein